MRNPLTLADTFAVTPEFPPLTDSAHLNLVNLQVYLGRMSDHFILLNEESKAALLFKALSDYAGSIREQLSHQTVAAVWPWPTHVDGLKKILGEGNG